MATSLARKLLFEVAGHKADTRFEELGGSLRHRELMKVHRSYLKPLRRAARTGGILKRGGAHHRRRHYR